MIRGKRKKRLSSEFKNSIESERLVTGKNVLTNRVKLVSTERSHESQQMRRCRTSINEVNDRCSPPKKKFCGAKTAFQADSCINDRPCAAVSTVTDNSSLLVKKHDLTPNDVVGRKKKRRNLGKSVRFKEISEDGVAFLTCHKRMNTSDGKLSGIGCRNTDLFELGKPCKDRNFGKFSNLSIKGSLQEIFRQSAKLKEYNVTMEINLLLMKAYKGALESGRKQYFLFCLRFFMDILCYGSLDDESRENCTKMVCTVALLLNKENKPDVLNFLVHFFDKFCDFNAFSVRVSVCSFIKFLYKYSSILDGFINHGNSCLSDELKKLFYMHLLERELDENPYVRLEVLKTLELITNLDHSFLRVGNQGLTPQQVLKRHLRDTVEECRFFAVQSVCLNDKEVIDDLVRIVQAEKSERIRCLAFKRLQDCVSVDLLSLSQRMTILKSATTLNEGTNKSSGLKKLVVKWLHSLGCCGTCAKSEELLYNWRVAVAKLLFLLDPLSEEALCHDVLIFALHYCKKMAMSDDCSTEKFLTYLICKPGEKGFVAKTYKGILNKSRSMYDRSYLSFFWRCLLDFCVLFCRNKDDLTTCYKAIFPAVSSHCIFVCSYTATELFLFGENEPLKLRHFLLMQLLKMFLLLKSKDTHEMKAWRDLVEYILTSYHFCISYEIVEFLVLQLFECCYPEEGDEGVLSSLCDLMSSIVHGIQVSSVNFSPPNETISVYASESTSDAEPDIKDDALLRCLMIINAIMKSGRFNVMNSLLRGLLDNVVEKGLIRENARCRLLAFRAMGGIAICDESCASERVPLLKDALRLDKDLQNLSFVTLSNFCEVYGFDAVQKWFDTAPSSKGFDDNLLDVFCTSIHAEDQDTGFTASECLCKLILLGKIDVLAALKRILMELILLKLRISPFDNSKCKICVGSCLEKFATTRTNQLLLVEVFQDWHNECRLKKISSETVLVFSRFVRYLIYLTGKPTCDEEESCAQSLLCRALLQTVVEKPDSVYTAVVFESVSTFGTNVWANIEILHYFVSKVNDVIQQLESRKQKKVIRLLQIFSQKLMKLITNLEVRERTMKSKARIVGIQDNASEKNSSSIFFVAEKIARAFGKFRLQK